MKFVAENIRSSLFSISSLLKNLIQWSRSDQQVIEDIASIDILDTLENLLFHNENGFTRKSVRIHIQIEKESSFLIQKEIFLAVLQVFIESASRFIAKNGELFVSHSIEGRNQSLVFQMIGFKITTEQFNNLFDLDYYHRNDLTYFEKGSGLGFVITQKLIEKLNGRINKFVHGKDDVFFEITFPMA